MVVVQQTTRLGRIFWPVLAWTVAIVFFFVVVVVSSFQCPSDARRGRVPAAHGEDGAGQQEERGRRHR